MIVRLLCPWRASLLAHLVKNQPAVWETWIRSLGWEDPLQKGMALHSSILAWRIPDCIVQGVVKSRSDMIEQLSLSFSLSVCGVLQAGVLEWVAISFSRGSSRLRDQTWVSCAEGSFLPSETPEKPQKVLLTHSK